ncbi:MAG: 23S rRNA (adenine(2503)-C(2))-methyltransferase RlmN [Fastidiosipilaceae bacterium]|jgi:23S rRNA (adenine2503-C2)-methyltransferase|nr:23S rRNA (adenine(2503)-C(2))-methyltransferase RlmN [Clostridiaceae bacterium]
MKSYIYNIEQDELSAWVEAHDYPAFRTKQLNKWLNQGIDDVNQLTNLPKVMRQQLAEDFTFDGLKITSRLVSQIDDTVKYTMLLADGNIVESVFMRYRQGTSVCISSQAGCRMGCRFCASTGLGFGRHLTAGEMFAQVALIGRDMGERIDHVTIMGIGEPLEDVPTLLAFLYRVNDPDGLNIGMRRLTVSTCGIIPAIRELATANLQITLAVSLHAPNDKIRLQLMPIAKKYKYNDLLAVCREYQNRTGRRMTYEYALFEGINDADIHAAELANRLSGHLCHVNLIRANPIANEPFQRSPMDRVNSFQKILEQNNIACTVRRELGSDIMAACGQLRRWEYDGKGSY